MAAFLGRSREGAGRGLTVAVALLACLSLVAGFSLIGAAPAGRR